MNYKPILSLLAILLLSSMVFAQTEEFEQGTDYNGAPTWDYYKTKLSFWDSVLVGNKPLTVVNGAQCSQTAQYSNSGVTTASSLCWDNRNGGSPAGNGVVHQGVAYQVFLSEGSNFQRIDEIGIQANTKGCIPVTPNKNYYRQAFYCDDISKTCTKEVSICNNKQGVVRERTCLSPSGVSSVERVTDINWKDSSVGTCSSGTPTGTVLPSNQQTANAGQTGSGGGVSTTELKGSYSNVIVPDNAMKGKTFYVTSTFKAENAGKYYLEATIFKAQLAAVSASGSKCDPSKQSAGEFVELKAGEDVQMTFNIVAPEDIGTKTIVVGAYSGCFSQGGKEITSVADDINVIDGSSSGTTSGSTSLVAIGIGAVGGGLIGFGVGGAVGAVYGIIVGLLGGWGYGFI